MNNKPILLLNKIKALNCDIKMFSKKCDKFKHLGDLYKSLNPEQAEAYYYSVNMYKNELLNSIEELNKTEEIYIKKIHFKNNLIF